MCVAMGGNAGWLSKTYNEILDKTLGEYPAEQCLRVQLSTKQYAAPPNPPSANDHLRFSGNHR